LSLKTLKAPARTEFLTPAMVAWRRTMIVLLAGSFVNSWFGVRRGLTEFFLHRQDDPVVAVSFVLLLSLYLARPLPASATSSPKGWPAGVAMALAVGSFAWLGSLIVYESYPLSMDEFLQVFDADIFRHGELAAMVPSAWKAYVPALLPQFGLPVPGYAYWVSNYLPVNAIFRALGASLGAETLISPLWAAISVLATFGVARRLWPEKPGIAVAASVLLATSAQLLVTGMTAYAMSAHLALNMVWLWLVLRGGKLGHGAAAMVAFLATGLHQIIFHPLFAAPFVLEFWLARRWGAALFHTCAYAVIGVFWMLYPPVLLHSLGVVSVAAASAGDAGIAARVLGLVTAFDPRGVGMMAQNLVRFCSWQSLLTIPLLLLAIPPALRGPGPLRAMALGILLTLAAMLVLLPYQGHGWGYRYLHGMLGSTCLLAAWAWFRLTDGAEATSPGMPRTVFLIAAAASVLVLLPIRLWQVHDFVHPYATASREIRRMDVDLVLVDDTGVVFGTDLVRNDPFLTTRPVVMRLGTLGPKSLRNLCATHSVRLYGQPDAKRAGIMMFEDKSKPTRVQREVLSEPLCGAVAGDRAR
jgi:hypothetical protein